LDPGGGISHPLA